jgi:hypothetical protein
MMALSAIRRETIRPASAYAEEGAEEKIQRQPSDGSTARLCRFMQILKHGNGLEPPAFQEKLAALPVTTYPAGDDVLTAGSSTGRLLILKRGAVEVVKEACISQMFQYRGWCSANSPRCWADRIPRTFGPGTIGVSRHRRADIANRRRDRHAVPRRAPRTTPRRRQPGTDRGQAPARGGRPAQRHRQDGRESRGVADLRRKSRPRRVSL